MARAPRSQHAVSPRVHSIILSVVLVPSRPLSPSFCPPLSLAQVGSAALRRAYTYTRTQRRALYVFSLSPGPFPSLGRLVPRSPRPRDLGRVIPAIRPRARSLFLLIRLGFSALSRVHGESRVYDKAAARSRRWPTNWPDRDSAPTRDRERERENSRYD